MRARSKSYSRIDKGYPIMDKKESSAFVTRLVTAAVLIPFGIFVIFGRLWNGFPIFISMLGVILVIAYEISNMMAKKGYRFYLWANSICITISFITFYLFGFGIIDWGYLFLIEFGLAILFCLVVLIAESLSGDFASAMENIGVSIFGFVSLSLFGPMIPLLKFMDQSGWLLGIMLLIAWLTDAGGLFIGKFFGRHKLTSLSSPNKTVEGYIGAVLFGVITGIIIYFVQKIFALSSKFSAGEMAFITGAIIIASIIGDLGESTLKRWANVKDSGDLLPGHGGLFDRFDSVLYSAPIYYVIIKFLGY